MGGHCDGRDQMIEMRRETDSLGVVEVPADKPYVAIGG
jgi:hypothetical protein